MFLQLCLYIKYLISPIKALEKAAIPYNNFFVKKRKKIR